MTERPVTRILKYIPGIVLIPLLTAPLPMSYHTAREIAGYFQALAFLRDGILSYTYLTPKENLSGLHLHSVLSSPLVGFGYIEGGRLVSWLSALLSVIAITVIIYEMKGEYGALTAGIASSILWVHPFFTRAAYSFKPEALSIALTTLSIAMQIKYYKNEDKKYIYYSGVTYALAVTTHLWEATVLLPLVSILVYKREFSLAGKYTIFGFVVAGLVSYITTFQPAGATTLATWEAFKFAPVAWFKQWFWLEDWRIGGRYMSWIALTQWFGTLATFGWIVSLSRRVTLRRLLMTSWLVSAAVIVFALPLHFRNHPYHVWGLIAPLAITVAFLFAAAVDHPLWKDLMNSDNILRVVFGILLISGFHNVLVSELGRGAVHAETPAFTQETEAVANEQIEAGIEVRKLGVRRSQDVRFVGESKWDGEFSSNPSTRILIYGKALHRDFTYDVKSRPNIVEVGYNGSQYCYAKIIKNGRSYDVRTC